MGGSSLTGPRDRPGTVSRTDAESPMAFGDGLPWVSKP